MIYFILYVVIRLLTKSYSRKNNLIIEVHSLISGFMLLKLQFQTTLEKG